MDPATVESELVSATIDDEMVPATIEGEIVPATIESEIEPATIESEMVPAIIESEMAPVTIESEMEPSTIESEMVPTTIESEMAFATTESEIDPTTIESKMVPPTIENDIEPATIESDIVPATIETEMVPPTIESEIEPSTTEDEMVPPTIERKMESATTESEIEPATIESKMVTATIDDEMVPAAIENNIEPATIENEMVPPTIESEMAPATIDHDDNNKKKIFIPAIGSLGDVKPYLVLAKELKNRGHKVWLGVHKRFEDQIKVDGIDTVEIGGDMEIILSTTPDGMELTRNPSIFKAGLIKRVFLPLIEEWFSGIVSGLKDADLIILSVTSIIAGLSCIEKYPNIKAVGIYTYPCTRTSEFSPPAFGGKSESLFNWINSLKWKMFEYGASNMYTDKINQLRANITLPPIKLNYDQMIRSILKRPMFTATIYSKCLIPRPSDWPENEFMVGPIIEEENNEFQPSHELLEFLNKWQNEKIIYIGIGSMMSIMFNTHEQFQFLTNIQTTMKNTNSKAIISLVGFQNIDENKLFNPENIFYLRQTIPHSWLFPKISSAIHHGGAGTTHTSLRYGLPTLILPFGADQPFNADRVFINKLGPRPIPIRQMNVRNLTNAIQDLMNNYTIYRNNAQKIGQLIKEEDGLGHCIQLIEKELSA